MVQSLNEHDTIWDITNELVYHLEKNEVSVEDKKILLDIFVNKKYGTDLQRERFIGCFDLSSQGLAFKSYSAYARSINRTYSSVIQAVNIFRVKINRRKDIADLTIIDEINIRSRK